MKVIILITYLFLQITVTVLAQTSPPNKSIPEKMSIFKNWEGHWQGEATMKQGPGPERKSVVNEQIRFKLDGRILVVEGIGTLPDDAEKVVHHAFGVLNYDESKDRYRFQTYLHDGKWTDAWFQVLSATHYQWGFDVPGGKIRYDIMLDPNAGTWTEKGNFSNDGNTWYPFMSMHLQKVN